MAKRFTEEQILFFAIGASIPIAITGFVWGRMNRKQRLRLERMNVEIAKATQELRDHNPYQDTIDELDRRIMNGKFWLQVTGED